MLPTSRVCNSLLPPQTPSDLSGEDWATDYFIVIPVEMRAHTQTHSGHYLMNYESSVCWIENTVKNKMLPTYLATREFKVVFFWQMHQLCVQKYPHSIIEAFQNNTQMRNLFSYAMCVVFCFCFGQDAVLVHCCARLAAELHAGVCFSSFINNFVTQLCFSTTSHNYGNLKSHWETRGSRGGIWLFLSISLRQIRTFDHTKAVCLPSQWSLSSPSIKKEREEKKEKLTICPQADADHISPPTSCLWCRRCVRSSAGQSRRWLSFHSLFHLFSPLRTLPLPPGLLWEQLPTSLADTPALFLFFVHPCPTAGEGWFFAVLV